MRHALHVTEFVTLQCQCAETDAAGEAADPTDKVVAGQKRGIWLEIGFVGEFVDRECGGKIKNET